MLCVQNFTYQPEGAASPILKDISFTLQKGDFCLLLGHNGSGKSTLLRLLAQGAALTEGTITLHHSPLNKLHQRAQKVRLIHQNPDDNLFGELTVLENYHLYAAAFGHTSIKDFLSALPFYHPQLSERLHTPTTRLSGGEKQALALCLALLTPPDLLLLDEHTSALDPHTATRIMQLTSQIVKAQAITCIATTHDLSHAHNYGNTLIALSNGQIRFESKGPEKSTLTASHLLEYCYNAV